MHTRLHGTGTPAQPQPPRPGPVRAPRRSAAHSLRTPPPAPPVPRQPEHRCVLKEVVRTHCSTPSTEPQPRRYQRVSWSGAPPYGPRWPPPSWELRREGGCRPRPGSALRRRRGMAKMAAAALTREGGEDAFRRLFRFYRQREPSDLRGVVDFTVPGGQVTPDSACPPPAVRGRVVRCTASWSRPAPRAVSRCFSAVLLQPAVFISCCSPRSTRSL